MACPVCSKLSGPRPRHFCSRRRSDVDLGRRLAGSYRVPTKKPAEEAEGPPPRPL